MDKIVFYKEWFEAVRFLPEGVRLEIYEAILSYGIDGEEKSLKPMSKAVFNFIKTKLDADIKEHNRIEEEKRIKSEYISRVRKEARAKREIYPKNYKILQSTTKLTNCKISKISNFNNTENDIKEEITENIHQTHNTTDIKDVRGSELMKNEQDFTKLTNCEISNFCKNEDDINILYNIYNIDNYLYIYNIFSKKENNNINILLQKKEKLISSILPYRDKYSNSMLEDFVEYWSEPTKNMKSIKADDQKTWSIGGRLSRWAKNNYNNRPTINLNTCGLPWEKIQQKYNELSIVPLVVFDDERKYMFYKIYMEYGKEAIGEVYKKVKQSPYLRGEVLKNGWKADFDFIFTKVNFRQILDGKYERILQIGDYQYIK